MKKIRPFVLLSFLLLIISAGSAYPQLSTSVIERPPNYDTFVPPAAVASFIDPVFGSTITRVSSALSMPDDDEGGLLTWVENEYSSVTPFNSDNSRFILVHVSYFGLYDGATGAYLKDLPLEINSSSEPRWSRKDNVTLYYHWNNQVRSYNITTGAIVILHTFSEYSAISGHGEMDISFDGDHLAFVGDNRYAFVYQISADTKFAVFDTAGRPFNSMILTPANNVIVAWIASGTARYTGEEMFDMNMNFVRQLAHADGHKDITQDAGGDEVLIWTNSDDPQPLANCNNGIVKIRLSDALQTCLLQLDWSLAVHITAPDGNGTAFVDTELQANVEPTDPSWVIYTNEILQIKLDGTGVTRWAHHRSRPVNTYNWQPKASISRDGTRMVFSSNFDLSSILGDPIQYSDTYMLKFPTTTGPTSIAGAVNAASLRTGPLSSNSFASLFGSNLANSDGTAGTSIVITDSAGNRSSETLVYVSPTQVNFLIPSGLAAGPGTLAVNTAGQSASIALSIVNSAPGLFSANGTGQGAAAAQAETMANAGSVSYAPVAQCGANGCTAVTVPLAGGTQVYLILYGTGVRGAKNVTVSIGGTQGVVTYSGAQGTQAGLDQINVLVPQSLAGSGQVDVVLTADGVTSNAVDVRF